MKDNSKDILNNIPLFKKYSKNTYKEHQKKNDRIRNTLKISKLKSGILEAEKFYKPIVKYGN